MKNPRVPHTAVWHHAMNRAASAEDWLRDHAGARWFLAHLANTVVTHPIDLHAFCVLPGHYHVLVRAERPALLHALRQLEAETGFPRRAEARAVPVSFGRHLMSVSRYIHLNPVDAGLVWCPENWPYSSFRAYLGDRRAPRFVVTEALLGRFGSIGARHRHRAYVYAGMDPGTRDHDGRPRWPRCSVPGSWLENQAWRVDPVLAIQGPPREPSLRRTRLPRVAQAVASAFGVPEPALRSRRAGGPAASSARGALVHAARSFGDHRLRDVAAWMGFASPAHAAAAADRFERAARVDPELAVKVRAALALLLSGSD